MNRQRPGMFGFSIIWSGQLVSLIGSEMTHFALALWAWRETGTATALALVIFFSFAPSIALSPIAGALVDRWNRKLTMMLADIGGGLATIAILLLYLSGNLAIWHLYVAGAFSGAFQAFQWPAYSAAITTMVDRKHYGRANGMIAMAQAGAQILAPLLAGILIATVDIGGVITIDIVTFLFAVAVLLVVPIPQPKRSSEGQAGRGSLYRESIYGFQYIWRRPSLLGLQLVFTVANLIGAMVMGLLSPMILARTGNDAQILGAVLSASGFGGLAGGLLMSVWGGPQRRVYGVLGGMVLGAFGGYLLLGIAQTLPLWIGAGFILGAAVPILNGSNQALWQAKTAPDVQGRVFAARRMIAQITFPVGLLLVGPLADFVFEPAMQPGGILTPFFGWLVGSGPGAGMALIIVGCSLISLLSSLGAYLVPLIREAERILPDYVADTDDNSATPALPEGPEPAASG